MIIVFLGRTAVSVFFTLTLRDSGHRPVVRNLDPWQRSSPILY
jgi:hypothetical protein